MIDTDTKVYGNTRRRNKAVATTITRSTCLASSSVSVLVVVLVRPYGLKSDLDITGRQQPQERKGPGLLTNLEVTLADMYRGKTAEVCARGSLGSHTCRSLSLTRETFLPPCSLRFLARSYATTVADQEQHQTGTLCNAPPVAVKA
jgi:hypothetical protein